MGRRAAALVAGQSSSIAPLAGFHCERIERENAESSDGQAVNRGGRGDHGVFDKIVRPAKHQACPDAKVRASMLKTLQVSATSSSQVSIAAALTWSCSRAISMRD
jgi:hypothetical protein